MKNIIKEKYKKKEKPTKEKYEANWGLLLTHFYSRTDEWSQFTALQKVLVQDKYKIYIQAPSFNLVDENEI